MNSQSKAEAKDKMNEVKPWVVRFGRIITQRETA
jgi:hypothetical protein